MLHEGSARTSAAAQGSEEGSLERGEVGDADGDLLEKLCHFAPLTGSEDASELARVPRAHHRALEAGAGTRAPL